MRFVELSNFYPCGIFFPAPESIFSYESRNSYGFVENVLFNLFREQLLSCPIAHVLFILLQRPCARTTLRWSAVPTRIDSLLRNLSNQLRFYFPEKLVASGRKWRQVLVWRSFVRQRFSTSTICRGRGLRLQRPRGCPDQQLTNTLSLWQVCVDMFVKRSI